MRIDILSLFPAIAAAPLAESMIGKAQQRGLVSIHAHNLRDWARDKHRTTDDAPYGGSQGMVMKCEPFFEAVESLRQIPQGGTEPEPGAELPPPPRVVLMSPAGRRLDQQLAAEYA